MHLLDSLRAAPFVPGHSASTSSVWTSGASRPTLRPAITSQPAGARRPPPARGPSARLGRTLARV